MDARAGAWRLFAPVSAEASCAVGVNLARHPHLLAEQRARPQPPKFRLASKSLVPKRLLPERSRTRRGEPCSWRNPLGLAACPPTPWAPRWMSLSCGWTAPRDSGARSSATRHDEARDRHRPQSPRTPSRPHGASCLRGGTLTNMRVTQPATISASNGRSPNCWEAKTAVAAPTRTGATQAVPAALRE